MLDTTDQPTHRIPIELVALAVMVAILFAPMLLSGEVLVSHDLVFLYYPGYPLYRDSLSRGELPLWNPYVGCGEPFLADNQRGALYPPNLIYLLASVGLSTVILSACHVLLAGVGAYALSRSWRVSRMGALLAGVVFAFNSFTLTRYEFPAGLHATAWYPLALALFVRWLDRPRRSLLALMATVLCLQFLSGYPEASLFTGASLLLLALLAGVVQWRAERRWSRLVAPLGGVVAAAGLAALLSMAQFLPSWEASALSYRSVVNPELYKASLHPLAIFTLLIPSLYGVPAHAGVYWAPSCEVYWLGAFYVGIVPLATFLVALPLGRLRGRTGVQIQAPSDPIARVRVPFLVALGVLFFLYALGRYTPLFSALWHLIPILHKFRWPPKCLMCVVLALSCLAGIGLDRLATGAELESLGRCRRSLLRWGAFGVFVLLGSLVAACLANGGHLGKVLLYGWFNLGSLPATRVYGIPWGVLIRDSLKAPIVGLAAAALLRAYVFRPRVRRTMGWLVVLLTFADLLVSNAFLLRTESPAVIDLPFEKLDLLRTKGELARYGGGWPMVAGAYNIRSAYNFQPNLTARVVWLLDVPETPPASRSRLMKFLNCDRVLTFTHVDPLLTGQGFVEPRIRRLETPLPRACVVGGVRIMNDRGNLLGTLAFGDFDPNRAALTDDPEARDGRFDDLRPGLVEHSVEITTYDPRRVEMRVESKADGLLVVSDSDYPGWQATVDGREVPIYRVNGGFRGVRVPSGTSTVTMVYRPMMFRIGAALSLVGIVLVGLLALPRRRSAAPPAA